MAVPSLPSCEMFKASKSALNSLPAGVEGGGAVGLPPL